VRTLSPTLTRSKVVERIGSMGKRKGVLPALHVLDLERREGTWQRIKVASGTFDKRNIQNRGASLTSIEPRH